MDWREKINNNHESRLDTSYRYTMTLYVVLILNIIFLPNSDNILYFNNNSIVIAAVSNYFNVFSKNNSFWAMDWNYR